jgi:hypothetical protein
MAPITSAPTPRQLKEHFIIPRTYIELIAIWLGLSISMTYQILRQSRKPSPKTIEEIYSRTGLPPSTWEEENLDTLAENVYTRWYNDVVLAEAMKQLF